MVEIKLWKGWRVAFAMEKALGGLFPKSYSFHSCARVTRGSFLHIYLENLVGLLEMKSMRV